MKRLVTYFVIVLLALAGFSGCYKPKDFPVSMTATIDTISFVSSGKIDLASKYDTALANNIVLTATSETYTPGTPVKPVIVLNVPNAIGVHYIGGDASAIIVTSASAGGGSVAASGSVNVLNNVDGRLQGSFDFTAADGTKVTGGHFSAQIPTK